MSYQVLQDRLIKGVARMLRANTKYQIIDRDQEARSNEYWRISPKPEDYRGISFEAGSTTYRGQMFIDFYSNKRDKADEVLYDVDIVSQALGENNYYRLSGNHAYFNGIQLGSELPTDEDDEWLFRIIYEASHTKVD